MNKTAHSRTRTEYQPMTCPIMSKVTQSSGIRIKTTPTQLNHNLTMRRHINSQSCFQQAHLLTVSKAKEPKTKLNIPQQVDSQDQSTKYILGSIIAKGSFGVVYKAHSSTLHRLAVKKILIKDSKNRELTMLKNINHPNILKMIDHYFTFDNHHRSLHIVTQEYSQTLKNAIQFKNTCPSLFPLYLYQILRGLVYLQQKQIIHRDLTPSNILVQKNTHKVVIADFGSAKISHHQPHSLSYLIARSYRAPQLVFGSMNYSTEVDIWAFGCIAAELVTGRPLFHSQSSIEHMLQIIKLLGTPSQEEMCEINPDYSLREYQSLPKIRRKALKDVVNSTDLQLLDLLSKILVYVPKKRITACEALQHPYFNCLRTCQFYQQHNIDPEQLSIQLNQSYQKQLAVGPSSIRLQSNHRRLISSVSKVSESTAGQSMMGTNTTGQSTMRVSGAKTFRMVESVARKLDFK